MPLEPQVLIDALVAQGDNPPSGYREAAESWFDAWWKYAHGMEHLAGGGEQLAHAAFVPALLPGLVAPSLPPVFFGCLELAMRAAWLALGTPVGLKQDVPAPGTFQRLSITPAPALFVPRALPVVAIGLAAKSQRKPPCQYLGAQIHDWTLTHTVAATVWTPSPSGLTPVPVVLPFT